MANELVIPGGDNRLSLPAHLQARYGAAPASEIVTIGDRLPSLSIKGKVFTITADGESWPMMKQDENGMEVAVGSLPVVILDYATKQARAYYEGEYDPADTKGPKCYSKDGVTPEDDSEEKQADKCAICPWSVKGSKVTTQGKSVTACGRNRLLAIVPAKRLDLAPLRLRIAQTSDLDNRSPDLKAKQFFAFSNYLDFLKGRGLPNTRVVVTTLSFDPTVAYPKLIFKASRFVNETEAARIEEILDGGGVSAILETYGTLAPKAALLGSTAATKAIGQTTAKAPVEDDDGEEPAAAAATTAKVTAPAGKVTPVSDFTPPAQDDGEDEDDYAERVIAARRAHKAAAAAAAEAAAKAATAAAKPAAGTTFIAPAMVDGEDEDDYAERVLKAKRAWKAANAAPAAAPAAFAPPAQEEGEDEDDYAERVLKAKRAWKAANGGAPAAAPAAAAPAAAAPVAEAPAPKKRRSKAEMEAARAAEAAAKGGAPVEAEPVPESEQKPAEKFLPGALSGGDLGGDDDDDAATALAAAPAAAAERPASTKGKAGAAPGPKAGTPAPAAAVPANVEALLDAWPDE